VKAAEVVQVVEEFKEMVIEPICLQLLQEQNKLALRDGSARPLIDIDQTLHQLKQEELMEVLQRVIGCDVPYFDPNFVLTDHNVRLQLAMHTRLICGVSCVLMGESGCGKTALILNLAHLWANGGLLRIVLLRIHGGITRQDIAEAVQKVCELGRGDKPPILFFDEANDR